MHDAMDFDRLLSRTPTAFDEARLRDRLAGRVAMVTGAGGSIGSGLCERLLELGIGRLVLVENHEPSLFRLGLRLRALAPEVSMRQALVDARDTRRMRRLIADEGVDVLFHVAAYKHVPLGEENADQLVATNVLSTLDLADAACDLGVTSFVYPSTDKAVRPPSIYGATKRVAELGLLARARVQNECAVSVIRLVNVFGTAGNVVEVFAGQIREGRALTLTDSRMTRYWMSKREATLLLASAACLETPRFPQMIDVGDPIPLVRTAERIAALMGAPMPEVRVVGLRPGERLHEELTYPYETLRPTEMPGVLAAHADRPPEDVLGTVSALRRAADDCNVPLVRHLLSDAVASMVAV